MNRTLILSIALLVFLGCKADSSNNETGKDVKTANKNKKAKPDFVKDFTTDICKCLKQINSYSSADLLYRKYRECALRFVNENENMHMELINRLRMINGKPAIPYEQKYDIDKQIVREGNINLIRECEHFRKSMNHIKQGLLEEMELTREQLLKSISDLVRWFIKYGHKNKSNFESYGNIK